MNRATQNHQLPSTIWSMNYLIQDKGALLDESAISPTLFPDYEGALQAVWEFAETRIIGNHNDIASMSHLGIDSVLSKAELTERFKSFTVAEKEAAVEWLFDLEANENTSSFHLIEEHSVISMSTAMPEVNKFDITDVASYATKLHEAIDAVHKAAAEAKVSPRGFQIDDSYCDFETIKTSGVVDIIDCYASNYGNVLSTNYRHVASKMCEAITAYFEEYSDPKTKAVISTNGKGDGDDRLSLE
ncbi:hypothetical protein AB4455_12205 [Vibrio sp. 10N.261.46.E12]|uniref:hypothetical protein n=1 Tax=unclassified Vibrio TaxID=2614977 RepID=UPI000977AF58|nr:MULTISPECIES: hypothetical protein [unclassified Vibrio]OMO34200.1 hypothetical protein BH584_13355 [Vibrio sp. 10N.261.45.E1]PMJ33151.1 hypothetical protein BCU27_25245 [Vibrio sp. 10N.286.45.B6]PML86359.1 hypothetical protein BCT66_14305 [Vibrio sp. 10N.261.49.E11]PMM77475.1 hypothetical protein BCT48_23745 [Vibrio sp. 10N.261.46.F12]PMM90624.1 hypothetical protein BCT46_03375 [Vibrio sp. 10N.261.46.E8]